MLRYFHPFCGKDYTFNKRKTQENWGHFMPAPHSSWSLFAHQHHWEVFSPFSLPAPNSYQEPGGSLWKSILIVKLSLSFGLSAIISWPPSPSSLRTQLAFSWFLLTYLYGSHLFLPCSDKGCLLSLLGIQYRSLYKLNS